MSAAVAQARVQQMLHAPLLPTLLRLATPNVMGLFATTIVIGYDGYILGRVGADALAGIALVFPLSMLMLQMSAGGIGGATTAAVARALGAGRSQDASRLAQQALLLAAALAALFMLVMLGFGRGIFGAMGGRGAALEAALVYSNVLFSGALLIWLTNVLAAVVRGAGNMVLPSVMLLGTALLHLALCPLLVFGWGPVPAMGVAGASLASLISWLLGFGLILYLLMVRRKLIDTGHQPFAEFITISRKILHIGLPAAGANMLTPLAMAVLTAILANYGASAVAAGAAASGRLIPAAVRRASMMSDMTHSRK